MRVTKWQSSPSMWRVRNDSGRPCSPTEGIPCKIRASATRRPHTCSGCASGTPANTSGAKGDKDAFRRRPWPIIGETADAEERRRDHEENSEPKPEASSANAHTSPTTKSPDSRASPRLGCFRGQGTVPFRGLRHSEQFHETRAAKSLYN